MMPLTDPSKSLVIYGAGETALLAYEYFSCDSPYRVAAFTTDAKYMQGDSLMGLPLVPFEDVFERYPPSRHKMFVAAGAAKLNQDRADMYLRAKAEGFQFASYISSKAFVWRNVQIGENCFILENNTLQPFTTIGHNTTMWSGNHVGHRSVVGDHCFISSHVVLSGFCNVGDYCFIGVNATIADRVSIATRNFIGMGSLIRGNTELDSVYTGVPAQKRNVDPRLL
jgi:sugar O-acyltransferase (sialic acid O-acetyltransferase NeuD family)